MPIPRPVEIVNLDTGEVYRSISEAGRAFGYLSKLPIPKEVRENGGEFMVRGYRLRIEV